MKGVQSRILLLGIAALLMSCANIASKEDVAAGRVGLTLSELPEDENGNRSPIVQEKSYIKDNGNHVFAIDVCYFPVEVPSPYYDCIIYHEVDETGIIVNAWPDPESWKARPREEYKKLMEEYRRQHPVAPLYGS